MPACALAVGVSLALAAQEPVKTKPAGAPQQVANPPRVDDQTEIDPNTQEGQQKLEQAMDSSLKALQKLGAPQVADRRGVEDIADSVLKKLQQIISKAAAVKGPVDEELRKLLVARREAGMVRVESSRAHYAEGRITTDRYYESINQLLYAQLELCDDPADQVQIVELQADLAKTIEKVEIADYMVGRGTVYDMAEARSRVLSFEIELLRAKRKLAKK
jgi:hypothetical protein